MSDTHIDEYTIQDYSLGDHVIAFLEALALGGFAWGIAWGLVQGAQFGLAYFEISLPEQGLVAWAVWLAFNGGPVLFGLLIAAFTYSKVLKME